MFHCLSEAEQYIIDGRDVLDKMVNSKRRWRKERREREERQRRKERRRKWWAGVKV